MPYKICGFWNSYLCSLTNWNRLQAVSSSLTKNVDNIQDAVLFLIKTIVFFAIMDPAPVTKKPPKCLSSPLCRKGCRYGFEGPDANGCFEACPPCSEFIHVYATVLR